MTHPNCQIISKSFTTSELWQSWTKLATTEKAEAKNFDLSNQLDLSLIRCKILCPSELAQHLMFQGYN